MHLTDDWIDAGYWPDGWLRARVRRTGCVAGSPERSARWRERIAAEMGLRRLAPESRHDDVPMPEIARSGQDTASAQFQSLEHMAGADGPGRIPVPRDARVLWAQHKYSVLARDQGRYRELGRALARGGPGFAELAAELIGWLGTAPTRAGLRNALQHMWGHVAQREPPGRHVVIDWPLARLLAETRWRAIAGADDYVRHSTALGELGAWLAGEPDA